MKTQAYRKSIIREILSSKARFFSILVIILLGVSFFAGIKSAGPDMNEAINKFYKNQNLMDSKLISTLGLTDKDLDLLRTDDQILDFYGSRSIDVNLTNRNDLVRFTDYSGENKINRFVLLKGRLPENSGEIALDEKAFKHNKDLKIGDEFVVDSSADVMKNFTKKKFTIVGSVRSPMYIEKDARGTTNVGKGTIDYFAVLNRKDLSMDVYTELYVRYKNVQGLDAYSDEYKDKMEANTKHLEDLFSKRAVERVDELKKEMMAGFGQVPQGAVTEQMIQQQETALKKIEEGKYLFFDRTDNPGYAGYKDAIKSLDNIASVLPVFFFLVAVLICLTTMTRMVEENRTEIGTLKALGYSDLEISWKYVIYAAIASVVGSALGILIGCSILPIIISNAYGSLYQLPDLMVKFYPSYMIQSLGISILCTVGAALFVLRMELNSKPSELMKVKAPKLGKKIFLERMTLFWNKLSFNLKVTLRNIFRYKQRMFMTVFGIAGCMALLVTGFGLKDSNEGLVNKQFNELWKYDAMVIFDDKGTQDDMKAYKDTLGKINAFDTELSMHQESVTLNKANMNKQSATLYVPEDASKLSDYIVVRDRVSGEKYELNDNGVIISEKLAKLLGVSEGAHVTFQDENNNSYKVKIEKITENYTMHYIYMSPGYYEKVFGGKPVYNSEFLKFNGTVVDEEKISSELLKSKNVINVTMKTQMKKSSVDLNESMNLVMVVIIVAAGALAFVVLYNLNNINVSERIRELSTIKVLGFFNGEVTMYILRENIILTLMGIVTGGVLGKALHTFILHTSETDAMMMDPNISWMGYVFSALITLFFSCVVMILMHIKLKNVNMIDALKSNE